MANIKLLSKILESSNSLIKSKEYKREYSIGNPFSRNRKLSFYNAICFIYSALL